MGMKNFKRWKRPVPQPFQQCLEHIQLTVSLPWINARKHSWIFENYGKEDEELGERNVNESPFSLAIFFLRVIFPWFVSINICVEMHLFFFFLYNVFKESFPILMTDRQSHLFSSVFFSPLVLIDRLLLVHLEFTFVSLMRWKWNNLSFPYVELCSANC